MQTDGGIGMNLKNRRPIILAIMLFGLSFILIGAGLQLYKPLKSMLIDSQVLNYYSNNTGDFIYLSDIEYLAKDSYTRYDKIRYDEVNNGGKITLKVENNTLQEYENEINKYFNDYVAD